jgi:glycosyltransferase involved in cell wall biosynthesis
LSAETDLNELELSIIITAKDKNDWLLKDLLRSIDAQTYPKDKYEVLVITEGDSESAKGIGVKRARGKYVCILASDNYLDSKGFLEYHIRCLNAHPDYTGMYPGYYSYYREDDILNRYFALIGGNDVIPFYLGKNDKFSYFGR